jgi:hypothetical protein
MEPVGRNRLIAPPRIPDGGAMRCAYCALQTNCELPGGCPFGLNRER